jgi:hypothetical protein
MPMPKSAVGTILDQRFASLFASLRGERDEAARLQSRELGVAREGADLAGRAVDDLPAIKQSAPLDAGAQRESGAMVAPGPRNPQASAQVGDVPRFVISGDEAPQFRDVPAQSPSAQMDRGPLQAPSASAPSWVWLASQALGANLKRLGFEPSELDDIRVSLIRVLAADYPQLKLLTKLPSSLSPTAPEKVVDDIRVMALAHMMNELLAKSVKDIEEEQLKKECGEDGLDPAAGEKLIRDEDNQKQNFEIPRSVSNRYRDIPAIVFDPTDVTAT